MTNDPLATYDALGRKQPKRLGFIEWALRPMPWLMRHFDKTVPSEFFAMDGDDAIIACPCGVDPPPRVPFNMPVRCEGEGCGRWFFFDRQTVRVATERAELQTSVVD